MKNLRNRLKKKLRSNRGFTLTEMLAALVMLILLILILNSGLNLAVKSYNDMTAESETELLMSTLSNVIYDELRYARGIDTTTDTDAAPDVNTPPDADVPPDVNTPPDTPSEQADLPVESDVITGNLIKYTSESFGNNTILSLREGQLYAGNKRVLASGAYGNGDYGIEQLDITYNDETCVFTVNLTVGGIDNVKATTEFKIRPLNSIKPEKGGDTA